ncbi:hypothetical protein [Reichenbachiella versicolor]|uniref:hypothetical protein n=1 Tax=Reichenbachiella versicolor TaxID=1821036 RepID=UPI000D6E03C1|nr:hypothetical protein [Reichenbachiella versicolor]
MIGLNSLAVKGQDIEEVIKAKPISYQGGFSFNNTLYSAVGIESRRDPYFWILNADINFDFFGVVSAPFSMTLTSQNRNYEGAQPFNQFGISPRYKSVTAHLGHRTMNFSSYTLAGNLFLGAGVEVAPENSFVRTSVMWGQFAKPVSKTGLDGNAFVKPTYRRMGYGFKVGLGREKHNVDLILFKAEDDENSIQQDSVTITPEENLVLGFNTKHKIGRRVSFEFEYAYSMFTRDKRAQEVVIDDYTFVNNFGALFVPNTSSEFTKALAAKTVYTGEGYQLNLNYREIDPGYRTMGSSFLNNDLRDISGGISWAMLQQKVNVALNSGFQQNNLNNQLASEVYRVIYGGNIAYAPSQNWNFNVTYSNFNSSTRQTQIQTDVLVDSLDFFSITRSGSFAINYRTTKTAGVNHNIFLNTNVQDVQDSDDNASTFVNYMLGHQMTVGDGWSISTSATYNDNRAAAFSNVTTGPVLTINKSLWEKKVNASISANMMYSYLNKQLTDKIYNLRNTYSLRLGEKHNFSASIFYLNKEALGENKTKVQEIRGNIGYSYRISS